MDRHDLNDDKDLDSDCCPVAVRECDSDMPLDLSKKKSHFYSKTEHHRDENRCESGYRSMESLPSGGSEINEGRFTSDDAAVAGLESLTLGNDDEKSKLVSIDEGFESTDLKSEDLISHFEKRLHSDAKSQTTVSENKETDNSNFQEFQRQVTEIFQQDEDGDTRLHTSIIQLLTDQSLYCIWICLDPSLLNLKNNYLQTPLHLAVITKQDLVTRKLMTSGALVDSRDYKGNTPLHIAAKEGYSYFVRILLEPIHFDETKDNGYDLPYQQIPQNLEARNYDGQLPIHLAAEGCHIEAIDVLLSKGADVNARDGKSGRTILHYAAESGCEALLQYLVEQKHCQLNLDATTYGGQTPIQLAKGRGNDEAIRILRGAGAYFDSEESSEEEEMNEDSYSDIKINGVIVNQR